MIQKNFTSKGIVLSRKYFSEADAIVTLLTLDFGKKSFVAKGIKRLTSKKRGTLEPFSEISFSATETNALPILTETQSLNHFSGVRSDLKKVTVAYYFLELVSKVSYEGQKDEDLYKIVYKYLKVLENTSRLKTLRKSFAKEILVHGGFWSEDQEIPEIDFGVEKIIEKSLNSLRVGRALM